MRSSGRSIRNSAIKGFHVGEIRSRLGATHKCRGISLHFRPDSRSKVSRDAAGQSTERSECIKMRFLARLEPKLPLTYTESCMPDALQLSASHTPLRVGTWAARTVAGSMRNPARRSLRLPPAGVRAGWRSPATTVDRSLVITHAAWYLVVFRTASLRPFIDRFKGKGNPSR